MNKRINKINDINDYGVEVIQVNSNPQNDTPRV